MDAGSSGLGHICRPEVRTGVTAMVAIQPNMHKLTADLARVFVVGHALDIGKQFLRFITEPKPSK